MAPVDGWEGYDAWLDRPPYSYTRDGMWNYKTFGTRTLQPMVEMIMIPTFGREVWWTIEEARNIFPEETIQSATSKPFL